MRRQANLQAAVLAAVLTLTSATPALACQEDSLLSIRDARDADAAVVGRVVGYRYVPASGTDRYGHGRLTIDIDRVLFGPLHSRVTLSWMTQARGGPPQQYYLSEPAIFVIQGASGSIPHPAPGYPSIRSQHFPQIVQPPCVLEAFIVPAIPQNEVAIRAALSGLSAGEIIRFDRSNRRYHPTHTDPALTPLPTRGWPLNVVIIILGLLATLCAALASIAFWQGRRANSPPRNDEL